MDVKPLERWSCCSTKAHHSFGRPVQPHLSWTLPMRRTNPSHLRLGDRCRSSPSICIDPRCGSRSHSRRPCLFTHQSVGSYSIRILPSKPTPVVPFRKRHPQQVLSKTRRDKIQWFIKRIFHPTNFPPKNHFYVLQFFLMAVRPASTNAPTFLGVHWASPVLGRHLQLAIPCLVMKGILLGQHWYQPQRPSFGNIEEPIIAMTAVTD